MKRFLGLFVLAAFSVSPTVRTVVAQCAAPENHPIDLAICLDISGSMSDLLDSVRGRVWDIVSDLSRAKPTPQLRVALITFGGEEPAGDGYIVKHTDFTGDLDTAYSKLMALNTNGGEEYVGWAIERAVESLNWSMDPNALRVIFLAGNESADQRAAEHDFRTAARTATGKDIIINSVYAGNHEQGIAEKWDRVAQVAKGTYTAIDVVAGTEQIETPYDVELVELNGELNRTYIPYGKHGAEGLANQIAQDVNAGKMGARSCGSRVAAKGCALYSAATWDLVDAVREEGFRLEGVEPSELPVSMRSMTLDQRRAFIKGIQDIRDRVKLEIAESDKNRRAFIRAKQTRNCGSGPSFDDALLTSLRAQAAAKGFTYPAPAPQTKVEVVAEPVGPMLPRPKLKIPVQTNVDALMAAMPAVEYGMDGYRTRRVAFAERLADSVRSPASMFVGDRKFTSASLATEALVDLLRIQVDELQTIRVVNAAPAPFAYVLPSTAEAKAKGDATCYRVGGFDFADRAIAERVQNDIRDALKSLDQNQGCKGPDEPAQLVSLKQPDPATLQRSVESYREKIKIIAEAAGLAYTMLVEGC